MNISSLCEWMTLDIFHMSLEVTECGLGGGRRWCRHDISLVILEKTLRKRSLRSAKEQVFCLESNSSGTS